MSLREGRNQTRAPVRPTASTGAADAVLDLLRTVVGAEVSIRLRCWDGSTAGQPAGDIAATVVMRDPRALRHLLWAPNELGLVRAYVGGDLDVEGDLFALLDLPTVISQVARHDGIGLSWRERARAARLVRRLGAWGPPPAPPAEEIRRRRGIRHSVTRDAASVSHHYDVGNDFYRLMLGPSLVYSCAYWASPPGPTYDLERAQRDKLDRICLKLGLREGMRLLDVGCGWGALALHAASEYGADVVGVTVSREQATFARQRVERAGLADRIEIRVQDYRAVTDGPYDAISSVGMSEHVGRSPLVGYAGILGTLLRPGGRLVNHAIASVRSLPDSPKDEPGFINRYVFPDGEVLPLSDTLDAFEQVGLELRDVETLREHYGLTLRAWATNLRDNWDAAIAQVGPARARSWLLYLAASALAFEHGNLTVAQAVLVHQSDGGLSGLPLVRAEWIP